MSNAKKTKSRVNGDSGLHLYSNGEGYADVMSRTASTLTDSAKLRRRLFAAHYIKTTNASSAARFAGFKSAGTKGAQLLREPYVQYLINEMLNGLDHNAIMTQNEILFQLKAEAFNVEASNQSARIAALAHIAKIRGMMVEKQEIKATGSNVMIVPSITSVDEWSESAEESQLELQRSVRE